MESFGIAEGGLDAFRDQLRDNMERELAGRLRAETKTRALDSLLNANSIDVPNALIDHEISLMQSNAMQQLNIEDPAQAPPRENFADPARRRAALGLLVHELIRAHEITLDSTRLDSRIEELVSQFDQPAEAARAYRADRDLMSQLEAGVLEEQVVDFLRENAKTSNESIDFSDFMAA